MTAAASATVLTLLDWGKRLDPNGKVPTIVELLSQTNEILDDMLWAQGNLPTGHMTTVRTGLPTVYWRMINQGIGSSKSRTAQITESTGMLEAWSEVDPELANLGGNQKAFRLSEAQAFIEAMNQEMAGTLFYGNSGTAPEEITGFAPRYSSLSATNADNILSAGGASTDNYSIWLVGWGENTVFGTFPQGSKAGLVHEDLGLVTIQTSATLGGGRMRAYQDRWVWKTGLVVKDWRYVVRICNIDVSDLVGISAAPNLLRYMTRATWRIPSLKNCKPVFYMNRTCAQSLDILTTEKVSTGGGITFDNVQGKRVASFRGIPIRICDQLVTETTAIS